MFCLKKYSIIKIKSQQQISNLVTKHIRKLKIVFNNIKRRLRTKVNRKMYFRITKSNIIGVLPHHKTPMTTFKLKQIN